MTKAEHLFIRPGAGSRESRRRNRVRVWCVLSHTERKNGGQHADSAVALGCADQPDRRPDAGWRLLATPTQDKRPESPPAGGLFAAARPDRLRATLPGAGGQQEDKTLQRDVKDIVGVLMRILDGGEISEDEVAELAFEAEGDLEDALNDAYVQLGEFARAQDARRDDPDLDLRLRGELHHCLETIVAVCDAQAMPRKH